MIEIVAVIGSKSTACTYIYIHTCMLSTLKVLLHAYIYIYMYYLQAPCSQTCIIYIHKSSLYF